MSHKITQEQGEILKKNGWYIYPGQEIRWMQCLGMRVEINSWEDILEFLTTIKMKNIEIAIMG